MRISADYIVLKDGRTYAARTVIERRGNYRPEAKRFHVSRIDITNGGNVILDGFFPDLRAMYDRPCRNSLCIGATKDDVLILHETKASRAKRARI